MKNPLVKKDWSLEFHQSFAVPDYKDKRFQVVGTATSKSSTKAQFAYDLIKNIDTGNTKSIQRNQLAKSNPYVLD